MPVDSDTDQWKSASADPSTRTDILDFLNRNSDQAFTAEEVAREVLGSDFQLDVPEEELPLEEMLGKAIGSTQYSAFLEAFVRSHLSALVYEGEVEVRTIPAEVDGEEMELGHYTTLD